eukprot:CAMPEP_0118922492 /NCGR_PEP_ID=MMETSP1169-20130426/1396_1 /TAXON_ID=36882 /ORGANISM="Pyramimonas obovata, Strain CCMP722" /LENGTH=564 /DNA_ID=CAMNT_0006863373 /DNA_START=466 /DNA_END=2160 /DNA_ORIENTATION=+
MYASRAPGIYGSPTNGVYGSPGKHMANRHNASEDDKPKRLSTNSNGSVSKHKRSVSAGGGSIGEEEEGEDYSYVESQKHLLEPTHYNPLPNRVPPPIAALAGNIGERHVLVMLGLPCRGKMFTSRRLQRYLKFFHGADCRRFDVCDYTSDEGSESSSFTDLFDDLYKFLHKEDWSAQTNIRLYEDGDMDDPRKKNVDSGRVAILFASDSEAAFQETWSGSSKERRRLICEQLSSMRDVRVKVIFVELICTDPELIKSNILRKVHASVPTELDDSTRGAIVAEWEKKIIGYRRKYVTMQDDGSEDDLSYIKLIDYGEKVVTNSIHGYLPMRIVQFLSNIHTKSHSIYLTRHGQSEYNVLKKLGGNPPLTEYGREYSRRLGKFAKEVCCKNAQGQEVPARLWTSSLQRTIETAQYVPHPVICEGTWHQMSNRVYRNLDEIFAGEYEGMTYDQIEKRHGTEATLRKMDKIGYRYPRGESYFDLIARLDPLVHELESYTEPILVVSHQATLRVIYSYFMDIDRELAPKQDISLHTVFKITYDGFLEQPVLEKFYLGPEVAPTHQTETK